MFIRPYCDKLTDQLLSIYPYEAKLNNMIVSFAKHMINMRNNDFSCCFIIKT